MIGLPTRLCLAVAVLAFLSRIETAVRAERTELFACTSHAAFR